MHQTREALPSAFITINKSRRRVYSGNSIFLPNNSDFEIELFNPTQGKIGVEFSFNGTPIESMLILNPGQRVFLERYLTENKKFNFSTYDVENTNEVKEAIAKNGDVEIRFFREVVPVNPTRPFNLGRVDYSLSYLHAPTYCNKRSNDVIDLAPIDGVFINTLYNTTTETGRVDKGEASSQLLRTVEATFETYAFYIINYKIYPESQKSFVTKKDISSRTCRRCNHYIRNNKARYCDACGEKL